MDQAEKAAVYNTCTDTLPTNQLNGLLLSLVDRSSFLMVPEDFLSLVQTVSLWLNYLSNTLSSF